MTISYKDNDYFISHNFSKMLFISLWQFYTAVNRKKCIMLNYFEVFDLNLSTVNYSKCLVIINVSSTLIPLRYLIN